MNSVVPPGLNYISRLNPSTEVPGYFRESLLHSIQTHGRLLRLLVPVIGLFFVACAAFVRVLVLAGV